MKREKFTAEANGIKVSKSKWNTAARDGVHEVLKKLGEQGETFNLKSRTEEKDKAGLYYVKGKQTWQSNKRTVTVHIYKES